MGAVGTVALTWRPRVAGVLTALTGAFIAWFQTGKALHAAHLTGYLVAGVAATAALGAVAMAGGLCAWRRRAWRTALVGAACALFPAHAYGWLVWTPLDGVAAVALLVSSRTEFDRAPRGAGSSGRRHPRARRLS